MLYEFSLPHQNGHDTRSEVLPTQIRDPLASAFFVLITGRCPSNTTRALDFASSEDRFNLIGSTDQGLTMTFC